MDQTCKKGGKTGQPKAIYIYCVHNRYIYVYIYVYIYIYIHMITYRVFSEDGVFHCPNLMVDHLVLVFKRPLW